MGSHNHIVHAEVVGRDGEKIQQFFSELFGWSLDTNNPGGYGMSDPETTGVAFGAGGTPDKSRALPPSTWLSTTSTPRSSGPPPSEARS